MPSQKEISKFSGHISNKDVPVLISALKGKVDFLITGDKKHFEKLKAKSNFPFKILEPSEFLELVIPTIIKELKLNK
jgi:predicted nucleic acid-binding protein